MAPEHEHSHSPPGTKLRTAFVLTALILAVELVGGLLSHSLALLSDAGEEARESLEQTGDDE